MVLLAALYVILEPVNRNLALVAALCRLLLALMWGVTALNTLGALRLLGDAAYLPVFKLDQLQTLARLHIATLRRVLRWPAVLGIGLYGLQLPVVQVRVYPESIGCLRCDLVCMVRNLCFRFHRFPPLRRDG